MDFTQYVMAGFVLVGLVNGINFALDRNWSSFVKFLTAVIFGGIFGYLHWSVEIGIGAGIASSGVYKIAQQLGGK